MKYYFSIGACFKNEHHCIKEWIEHYKFHGVDHIYLINDFSTPEYEPIIQPYIDEGYITLYHNDIITKEHGRQNLIYEKYLKQAINENFWLGIVDLDEFLYSPSTIDIKVILKNYEYYAGLKVPWIHFGSNGHIKQPKGIVENFTMRAKYETNASYYQIKTIIKTFNFISFDVHDPRLFGSKINFEQDSTELLINHYNIQSLEFYLNIKGTRGDVNNWADVINLKRNKELFDEYDLNEELDERLKNQNKNLIF